MAGEVQKELNELHQLRLSVGLALGEIKNDLEGLNEKYDALVNVVSQQSKIIRDFEDQRQRQIGAQNTVRFIWGLLTAGVAGIAYVLHDVIQFLWEKH